MKSFPYSITALHEEEYVLVNTPSVEGEESEQLYRREAGWTVIVNDMANGPIVELARVRGNTVIEAIALALDEIGWSEA